MSAHGILDWVTAQPPGAWIGLGLLLAGAGLIVWGFSKLTGRD